MTAVVTSNPLQGPDKTARTASGPAGDDQTTELAPGTGLNYLVLSAHDFRSHRKANIHFISQQLAQRGQVRFFSLRFSRLSRYTSDPRLSLTKRANRVERHEEVDCYLWKTMIHPFNTRRRWLRGAETLMYQWYQLTASPVLREWIRDADVILFESGIAPVFFDMAKSLNPTARTLYIASDDLDTIGVANYVKRAFQRAAPRFSQIRLPSASLACAIPSKRNLRLIPHGIDHRLNEGAESSPYGAGVNAVSVGSMLFDPLFFVEASQRFPDIHFHIIGCGQSAHPEYGPNVTVHGEMPHQETVNWIRHADLGIAPYKSEQVPPYLADTSMKLIQYDFLGLPAVCPTAVVGDYTSRFGYRPGDGDSIEAAVLQALGAPRGPSRRHLDWSEVTDRLLVPERFQDTEMSS